MGRIFWGYRVFRVKEGYTIGEVVYDEEGNVVSCSRKSIEPFGETLAQLGVLCGHADGAGIKMANAHHDAAQRH